MSTAKGEVHTEHIHRTAHKPFGITGVCAVQCTKRMPLRTTAQRGFTLIELLLVIALLAALGGMFSLNVGAARDQARLEASARELQSFLREAQTMGRTGRAVTNSGCDTVDKYDCGYGVYIKKADGAAGTADTIILYSGAGASSTVIADNQFHASRKVRELSLQPGVTIGGMSLDGANEAEAHIHFRRGLLGAAISVGSDFKTTASTTLTTASGFRRSVVVNTTGLIYVE